MLRFINLGQTSFEESLALQLKIQKQRQMDQCEDTLLLVEHEPVLTKGIRTEEANILLSEEELAEKGVKVHQITRGGDVTYHGPGQIVGYIIMKINRKEMGIRAIVKNIEQITINILKENFNIEAHTEEKKYTGVFVGNEKLTAVGIAVNRGVTMHGFAMNVNTDLSYFDLIVPCGLSDRSVTSMEKLTGAHVDMEQIKKQIITQWQDLFDTEVYELSKGELMESLEVEQHEDGNED